MNNKKEDKKLNIGEALIVIGKNIKVLERLAKYDKNNSK